jgi:CDP-diacylglycerol pyrophosphatase
MRLRSVLIVCLSVLCLGPINGKAASRSALGIVVSACHTNSTITSSPAPCLAVETKKDAEGGYAVLREPGERQRTILTALSEITGIEDPRLLKAPAPNFFADAWRERYWLLSKGNSDDDPPNGFALGINSPLVRSQDRLHIHIACLRPDIQAALAPRVVAVNPNRFARLNFRLGGRVVSAMRIDAADTLSINPIQILLDKMPGVRAAIGAQTLIAVRETLPNGRPAIVLLTNPSEGSGSKPFTVERLIQSDCN